MAATATSVVASDNSLFRYGVTAYKDAVKEIDHVGAFPRETARHENAIHYQGFALAPLVLIAEFASRQDFDLYAYNSHHRTLRDAILFYGRAVADPTIVDPTPPTPKAWYPPQRLRSLQLLHSASLHRRPPTFHRRRTPTPHHRNPHRWQHHNPLRQTGFLSPRHSLLP